MKKPSILFVETHFRSPFKEGGVRTSAVDWWRVINPAEYLRRNTDWNIETRKGIMDEETAKGVFTPEATTEWEKVALDFDLVFCSYFENGIAYAYLHTLAQKYGLKYIIDMDDDIFNIAPYNPVNEVYEADPMRLAMLKENMFGAPHLSVTNGHLKDVLKKFRDRPKEEESIHVLPNAIDLSYYAPIPHVEDEIVTIGYQGGATHYADLMQTPFGVAMSYILGKYHGKVQFDVFGFIGNSEFEGMPGFNRQVCATDFPGYVALLREKAPRWDIGVAPLEEIEFNQSKSHIKWMEYAAYGIPTIASDYGPYKMITDGRTGLKVTTTKQWIDAFELLINNHAKRHEIGEAARAEVARSMTIEQHGQKYKTLIEEVLAA